MALVNPFGPLSLEETQTQIYSALAELKAQQASNHGDIVALVDTLVTLVEAVRNLAPLPDSADRIRVAIETGSVGIAANTTLATVGAVESLSGGYKTTGLAYMGFNTPALQLIGHGITVAP